MPYPDTMLTRPIRRTIMVGLILLFFIISPVILGYTAGYRYDFDSGQIQQTGVISVDIQPRDAVVRLNNTVVDSPIPMRIPNLAPGTYNISISAPGKKTWERDISVESKQTTYIRGITLFEDALPIEVFQDPANRIVDVRFSASGEYAIIVQETTGTEDARYTVLLFESQAGDAEVIATITNAPQPYVEWSPFTDRFIIIEKSTLETTITYGNPTEQISLVHELSVPSSSAYQWNKNTEEPSIFIENNNQIFELTDTRIRELQFKTTSPVWYIDEEREFWVFDAAVNQIQVGQRSYQLTESIDTIIDTNTNRIIASNNDRILLIRKENGTTSQQYTSAFSRWYASQTNEWLVWTPWELTTFYETGNKEVLNRTSEPIVSVRPLDEFGLLLLATDSTLFGFNPGFYVTHELFNNINISSVGVHLKSRNIYFYGTVGTKTGIFELAY